MSDERQQLKAAYARALGLKHSTPTNGAGVPGDFGNDANEIVKSISSILGEVSKSFMIPQNAFWGGGDNRYCNSVLVQAKLGQLISYLEHMFHVSDRIIEIGSLFNSIRDEELKNRCSDLLSAPGNFDRVINQATQVLEDRIRKKSRVEKPLTGVPLVNAVLNADPARTILPISDNAEEHEGICHICRGVMLAFRNPTHHQLLDKYTREDALKLCAFIDNLLHLVDASTLTTVK